MSRLVASAAGIHRAVSHRHLKAELPSTPFFNPCRDATPLHPRKHYIRYTSSRPYRRCYIRHTSRKFPVPRKPSIHTTKVFAPVFDHSVISLAFRTISWDHGIKIVIFCCDEFIYFLNQAALIKLTAAVPARE
jgi:hypothetical protein